MSHPEFYLFNYNLQKAFNSSLIGCFSMICICFVHFLLAQKTNQKKALFIMHFSPIVFSPPESFRDENLTELIHYAV